MAEAESRFRSTRVFAPPILPYPQGVIKVGAGV